MNRARRRTAGSATALGVAAASLVVLGAAAATATPAAATVTIDAPEAPHAGPVDLTGSVRVGAGEVTTVLYVIDATRSTSSSAGSDCSGNGTPGPEDDLNADGSVGDILDCEIAGVESLNGSLSATTGVQVGLVGFANEAAAADVDPAGAATFVPPRYTGGDPRPRLDTVAQSVVREKIGLYEPKDLGGSGAGSAFNSAVSVALSTLGTAPAGPKWIMFLSDGQAPIDDGLLDQLTRSGVRLRSFGIGDGADCAPSKSLYKMASATGESCNRVRKPASLAAGLTGSQPDALNGVTVSIDNVAVAATVDAVGGWKAGFTLGAGTYTAVAKAVLASGATSSAQRTFTVASAANSPAPGAVSPGPGALRATVVKVARPKPSRAALPSRVKGRVGSAVNGLTAVPRLSAAKVLLQARSTSGASWTTVDRTRANRAGAFVLKWRPKARLRELRVVLSPVEGFAGSAAAVPTAKISACKVKKRRGGWSVTCRTTARTGSRVRLRKDGDTVDRARVRRGKLRLTGKGRVGAHTIDVRLGKKRHVRLAL